MPETLPERADLRQLRLRAKELLEKLRQDDPEAIQLASSLDDRIVPSHAKLADAQRLLARNFGFATWTKLVSEVETPQLIEQLRVVLQSGETELLDQLLKNKPKLRQQLNKPLFGFDAPPIVWISGWPQAARLIPILVRYGADPNARSTWWAGGYSALDGAKGETVEVLLEHGAKFDIWSAAAHGRLEVVRQILDDDPEQVNAPGGDGERALHFASTPEIAELLIERGASLNQRDVDHESTPIQYQILNSEVVRVLLRHGAEPDIFTAIAIRDGELLRKILEEDQGAAMATIGKPPFVTIQSEGGHIYQYRMQARTPQQFAAALGFRDMLHELDPFTSPTRRAVSAAWLEDKDALYLLLADNPNLAKDSKLDQEGVVARAALQGKTETVNLLMQAGFDPLEPGMDSGSALHLAAWSGNWETVRLLTQHVPVELTDANHGSTPLGWALHGAQWCQNPRGDYLLTVRELLQAGANPAAPANRAGGSLLQWAKRQDLREELKKFGQ